MVVLISTSGQRHKLIDTHTAWLQLHDETTGKHKHIAPDVTIKPSVTNQQCYVTNEASGDEAWSSAVILFFCDRRRPSHKPKTTLILTT